MITNFTRRNNKINFYIDLKYAGKVVSIKIDNERFISMCVVKLDGEVSIEESIFNKFKNDLFIEGEQLGGNKNMEKYSLSFGINQYLNPMNNLRGCVNDATNWRDLLKNKFGFDSKLFLDSDANSKNFNDSIVELTQKCTRDDIFVLTYSGHGSSVIDIHNDEIDGRDECICLYDRFFIDDEIKSLFSKFRMGVKICFISDSCHSGTVTRAFNNQNIIEENLYKKAKYLPPENDNLALSISKLPLIGEIKNMIIEDDMIDILIAGCKDTEYSYDTVVNGTPCGAFSYYAQKIIEESDITKLTYEEFYNSLKKYLPSDVYSQTPQLEGKKENKERIIFS